jgi:uncharacterized repeat protein (TIGR03803 family)
MRQIKQGASVSKLSWWKTACAVALLCAAAAIASPAQTFTTLVNFDRTNGANPYLMSLVQGTDGNLYGTTSLGGANALGTVFKVTPTGTLTTLHSFAGYPTDGAYPQAGLVMTTNGTFYGTTSAGGANDDGTVFSITSGGTLTTLLSFDYTDGAAPYAALVQASNGNFYGTTTEGGASNACPHGCGTVFSITSGGALTTLLSFDYTDGYEPLATLVQATNGTFYGTTSEGGANGDGTVFSITSGGTLTTLDSFDGTDGQFPYGGLVQATNGNFYGTAFKEGASDYGTVFSITLGGALTTLLSFDLTDGAYPTAALVQATNGNFYGTTDGGGASDYGTVFSITSGGTLTTLHSFDSTDGQLPYGGLVQATNGSFYGTTYEGGTSNYGTIFSLAVGVGPFVETVPTSGKVEAAVRILGTNLTGATSVTFNGTAATFTVVSRSEITTTVPTGATTGKVKVVTPSRTLTSNVSFRVLP